MSTSKLLAFAVLVLRLLTELRLARFSSLPAALLIIARAAGQTTSQPDPKCINIGIRPNNASFDCATLHEYLSDDEVVSSADLSYVNRTRSNWSSNCWQNATCFVTPRTPTQVGYILKLLSDTTTRFSVRSGGHNFNVNHSSTPAGGVVLDMRYFNQIELSEDKRSIIIGAGCHWGDVYKALNGTGVSVNGARSPNPGVGGQTLGAGIGWLSSIAGVSAASVMKVSMVLGNGTIIHADSANNPDLLWAVKGGGPNFGIITAYTFKTLPIDQLWFESRTYTADKNQQILSALSEYQVLADKDPNATIVLSLSANTAQAESFIGFVYLQAVKRPPVFEPFFRIEPDAARLDSTFGSLADLSLSYNQPQYPEIQPSRQYVVSLPHRASNITYQAGYIAFQQLAGRAQLLGGSMAYGSQPIARTAVRESQDTPLGLDSTIQDWIHVTVSWSDPKDDAQFKSLIHKMGGFIQSAATKNGDALKFRFMNDAFDGQNVLGSYGDTNVAKLKAVARKYDPDCILQRLQTGGWLLSRS